MYLQTIVFDLDGTLLDSLPGLLHSTNAALARCGYPLRTYDEVRAFVGNGIGKLIERALPGGLENPDYAAAWKRFGRITAAPCLPAASRIGDCGAAGCAGAGGLPPGGGFQ